MEQIISYPPPMNPEYERENMDALGEWELERRTRELCRDIDRLECQAWAAECDLNLDEAERLVAIVVAKREEYRELQQQLEHLESGW